MFTFLTKVIIVSGFYINCHGIVMEVEKLNSILDESKSYITYTVDLTCKSGSKIYHSTAKFNPEELKAQ